MINYINRGGISIHPDFFGGDQFDSIKSDLLNLDYKKVHQPHGDYYGNRLQAYPCYEADYNKENDYVIEGIEDILKIKIIKFKALARKTLMSELQQSPQSFDKYGFVHKDCPDGEPALAGMMYFDQAFDGGTAFFANQMDKIPDIYISAYPNRLVLYHGNRFHAPAIDYTFKERLTLTFFCTFAHI
tara:strand:+ start:136 stop:693 length:558 start_codon:yes stop_codon:yes gene_type:complete